MGVSNFITGYWFIWVPGIDRRRSIGFFQWKKTDTGRAQWDALKLKIPVHIGDVIQKVAAGALVADLRRHRRLRSARSCSRSSSPARPRATP